MFSKLSSFRLLKFRNKKLMYFTVSARTKSSRSILIQLETLSHRHLKNCLNIIHLIEKVGKRLKFQGNMTQKASSEKMKKINYINLVASFYRRRVYSVERTIAKWARCLWKENFNLL